MQPWRFYTKVENLTFVYYRKKTMHVPLQIGKNSGLHLEQYWLELLIKIKHLCERESHLRWSLQIDYMGQSIQEWTK